MDPNREMVDLCCVHNEVFETTTEKEKHERKFNCYTVKVCKSDVSWMRDTLLTSLAVRGGGY